MKDVHTNKDSYKNIPTQTLRFSQSWTDEDCDVYLEGLEQCFRIYLQLFLQQENMFEGDDGSPNKESLVE